MLENAETSVRANVNKPAKQPLPNRGKSRPNVQRIPIEQFEPDCEDIYDSEATLNTNDDDKQRNSRGAGYTPLYPMEIGYPLRETISALGLESEGNEKSDTTSVCSRMTDASTLSRSVASGLHNQHRHTTKREHRRKHEEHRNPQMRIDEPSGYWTLPHPNHRRKRNPVNVNQMPYHTPGGRILKRMHKTHTAGVQHSANSPTLIEETHTQISRETFQGLTKSGNAEIEGMLSFRYGAVNTKPATRTSTLDFIIQIQALCRGWIARKRFKRLKRQTKAIRIIQRNAPLFFDPWMRLMIVLRPFLKQNNLEEQIIFLKSEIERYKAMVKVLRYENAAYQDKIARLLQLLDQMNNSGANSEVIQRLAKEVSLVVVDHQKQWLSMIANVPGVHNPTLADAQGPNPVVGGDKNLNLAETLDDSKIMSTSTYQQARDDAEFYRAQVEMLREAVDEQNDRTSHHYEEKIGVLSERVEQLQNLLTNESMKNARLTAELDESSNQATELQLAETNLQYIVEQLNKQLNPNLKRDISSPIIVVDTENTFAAAPPMKGLSEGVDENDDLLNRIRQYFISNPKAMAALQNTPLTVGGELDIFTNARRFANVGHSPKPNGTFFPTSPFGRQRGLSGSVSLGTESVPACMLASDTSQLSVGYNPEANTLRSEIEKKDNELQEMQKYLESEQEDKEFLEMESLEQKTRIAAMIRQLKRIRDEHEEELVTREQAYQRKVRDMQEQLDEEASEKQHLDKRILEMDHELAILRRTSETQDIDEGEEWQATQAKLIAELKHYRKTLDIVKDEYDQFRKANDGKKLSSELTERDKRISQLEVDQHHLKAESEVLSIKLQNATTLLDETEHRSKVASKEKQQLMQRLTQLEGERESAMREAATSAGRATADREAITSRTREVDDLRNKQDQLQREIVSVKLKFTESNTRLEAEKASFDTRYHDLNLATSKRQADLQQELERFHEQVEQLQQEVGTLQTTKTGVEADNRYLKRQITDLKDQVDDYSRRVSEMERRNLDLQAQLDATITDLSHARQTEAAMRARQQTHLSEDWLAANSLRDDDDYSDDARSGGQYGSITNLSINSLNDRTSVHTLNRSSRIHSSRRALPRYSSTGGSKAYKAHKTASLSRAMSPNVDRSNNSDMSYTGRSTPGRPKSPPES